MIFLSQKFKAIRKHLDLTQEDVAKKIGLKYQSVQAWENGKTAPKSKHIYGIAEIFQCDPCEFVEYEPGEYIPKTQNEKRIMTHEITPELLERLNQALDECGGNQAELSRKIGIEPCYLNKYLSGKVKTVSYETMKKLREFSCVLSTSECTEVFTLAEQVLDLLKTCSHEKAVKVMNIVDMFL